MKLLRRNEPAPDAAPEGETARELVPVGHVDGSEQAQLEIDGKSKFSSIPFAPLVLDLYSRASRRGDRAIDDEGPAEQEGVSVELAPAGPSVLSPEGLSVRFRRSGDRRRASRGRRVVTLNIEDGVVRVLAVNGNEVVAWGTSDPDEGTEYEEAEFGRVAADETTRARELLADMRLDQSRLVTDMPLYSALMRHFTVPSIGRRYQESVIMSEVVDSVPFQEDEIDIKWHLTKDKDAQKVAAAVVQRKTIDEHVQLLEGSILRRPSATFSQATALAVATGVPDAIILHIGAEQAAIILVRDSIPHAVHQLSMADKDRASSDQADALSRAIVQIIGYDQTAGADQAGRQLPLIMTGRPLVDGTVPERLRQLLQREVLPATPDLEWPEDFPSSEFVTNLGLAILDLQRPRLPGLGAQSANAAHNLLSERHVTQTIPVKKVAVFAALGLFAVASYGFTPEVSARVSEVKTQTATLEQREEEERLYRIRRGSVEGILKDIRRTKEQTLALEAQLVTLQKGIVDDMASLSAWYDHIEVITDTIKPPGVVVGAFEPSGDRFVLRGLSQSLSETREYTDNIVKTGLFTGVELTQVNILGGIGASSGGVSFVIEAEVLEEDEP